MASNISVFNKSSDIIIAVKLGNMTNNTHKMNLHFSKTIRK